MMKLGVNYSVNLRPYYDLIGRFFVCNHQNDIILTRYMYMYSTISSFPSFITTSSMSTYNGRNTTGIAHAQSVSSISAFLASFVTNTIIWTVEIGLFIILRTLFKRIYQPRTVLSLHCFGLICSLYKPYLRRTLAINIRC